MQQLARAESQEQYERSVFIDYVKAQYQATVFSDINHLSTQVGGRFPLTGVGDANLFAYFAELGLTIVNTNGAMGMVLPAGILTDKSTMRFTQKVIVGGLVRSIYHFNNSSHIFSAVAANYSFMLLTIQRLLEVRPADCVFYATDPKQLEDKTCHLSFDPGDIALINPNTQTAILVRSSYDLELCRKLYRAAPILIKDGLAGQPEINPWRAKTIAMFHMTNDRCFFESLSQQDILKAQELGLVPLYEGKMFWQFDHRFASFCYDDKGIMPEDPNTQDIGLSQKQDASHWLTPQHWVKKTLVQERWKKKGWTRLWALAWRDVARATDERTVIASVLPAAYGVGNTAGLLMPDVDDRRAACLLAQLNSLVVDFVERIKQSSAHVNIYYLKQLPVLPPEAFAPKDVEFIASRVAQLTRTADDINAVWLTDYPAYTFQEPKERVAIRAELDAYIAKMYGLTREELAYILDPAAVMGPDHPSETFPKVKRKEIKLYGEYLTQRLVLKAYDDLVAGVLK